MGKKKAVTALNLLIAMQDKYGYSHPSRVMTVKNEKLLESLKEKITEAIEKGVDVKSIWNILKENGFTANCPSFAIWLDDNGIKKKNVNKKRVQAKRAKFISYIYEKFGVGINDEIALKIPLEAMKKVLKGYVKNGAILCEAAEDQYLFLGTNSDAWKKTCVGEYFQDDNSDYREPCFVKYDNMYELAKMLIKNYSGYTKKEINSEDLIQ